jgi:RNA polymerase sigma factor (sigma-70 family)
VVALPRHVDIHDLKQNVNAELYDDKSLGRNYLERIEAALNKGESFRESAEYQAVKAAVWKVWHHARSTHAKRKQRGLPQEVRLHSDLPDHRHSAANAKSLVEETLDLKQVLDQLTERERLIWAMLMEGKTMRTIGEHLGISFQVVARIRSNLINKLAAKLSS